MPQQDRQLTTDTAAQCTIEGEDFRGRRLTHPTESTHVFLILDQSTDSPLSQQTAHVRPTCWTRGTEAMADTAVGNLSDVQSWLRRAFLAATFDTQYHQSRSRLAFR